MIDEVINRSAIGSGGFLATLGLGQFNELVSIAVGLATFAYMCASIYKLTRK